MKKSLLLVAPAAAVIGLALAGPAYAAGGGYGSQPGYGVANSETACAGHGSFGAFGQGNNLAGGADGTQTGINNSNLCGNPQN